jgi:hypothetical protein
MNTIRRLALRRQSIRTLTTDELRVAHGGDSGNHTGGASTYSCAGTTAARAAAVNRMSR